jgi:hypothetical protein
MSMQLDRVAAAMLGQRRASEPVTPAYFWFLLFPLVQMALQVALLVPFLGSSSTVRMLVRVGAFSFSLLLLVILAHQGRRRARHPAYYWAVASLCTVFFGIFHPEASTNLACLAHFSLYLAILAPLFWVERFVVSERLLWLVFFALWGFHTLSAAVGVLQVYNPGRYQPQVSSVISGSGAMAEGLKINLATGERIYRPMGLTDMPGGAASAGLSAFLFGLGFFLNSRSPLIKALALVSMMVGLFCIYLCQVRSLLIMAGICTVTFALGLALRRDMNRVLGITLIVPWVVLVSFMWAVSIGGSSVTARLNTLIEDRTVEVYYRHRGIFLEETINILLPQYPFGAGLGRWGMMSHYFGIKDDPNCTPIWVEIQWTGWLLDGGLPLIFFYTTAILVAMWAAWKIARSPRPGDLPRWAMLIVAYDMAVLAVTFNYPVFIGSGGMEFWFLNALLFAAAQSPATSGTAVEQRQLPHARARPRRPLEAMP